MRFVHYYDGKGKDQSSELICSIAVPVNNPNTTIIVDDTTMEAYGKNIEETLPALTQQLIQQHKELTKKIEDIANGNIEVYDRNAPSHIIEKETICDYYTGNKLIRDITPAKNTASKIAKEYIDSIR